MDLLQRIAHFGTRFHKTVKTRKKKKTLHRQIPEIPREPLLRRHDAFSVGLPPSCCCGQIPRCRFAADMASEFGASTSAGNEDDLTALEKLSNKFYSGVCGVLCVAPFLLGTSQYRYYRTLFSRTLFII